MKRIFAGVLAMGLAMAAPAFAQTVNMPVRVNVGDQYTLSLEDTQVVSSGKDNLMRMTYRSTYAISVEAQDLWRYTPIKIEIVEFTEPPNPTGVQTPANINKMLTHRGMTDALSAMMRLTTDIGFLCRVDSTGRCVSLENWPQWRARVENLVMIVDGFASAASVLPPPAPPATTAPTDEDTRAEKDKKSQGATLPEATSPAPVRPAASQFDWMKLRPTFLNAVNAMIDSVDGRVAASVILYPIMGPSGVQGQNLSMREGVRRAEEWPMPFGAGPIVVDSDVKLVSVDQAAHTARVSRRATVRPDSVNRAITASTAFADRAIVQPFMGAAPSDQPSALAQMVESAMSTVSMSFADDMTATIDLRTGLVKESQSRFAATIRPPAEPRNARAQNNARGRNTASTPVEIEWTQRATITSGAPPVPRLERPAP